MEPPPIEPSTQLSPKSIIAVDENNIQILFRRGAVVNLAAAFQCYPYAADGDVVMLVDAGDVGSDFGDCSDVRYCAHGDMVIVV